MGSRGREGPGMCPASSEVPKISQLSPGWGRSPCPHPHVLLLRDSDSAFPVLGLKSSVDFTARPMQREVTCWLNGPQIPVRETASRLHSRFNSATTCEASGRRDLWPHFQGRDDDDLTLLAPGEWSGGWSFVDLPEEQSTWPDSGQPRAASAPRQASGCQEVNKDCRPVPEPGWSYW